MSVTYCVVVPFDRVEGGDLVRGEAKEAPNREAAKRRAEAMATKHAGALAFSRFAAQALTSARSHPADLVPAFRGLGKAPAAIRR